ncbi:hypothetical protein AC249_AIPGENE10216 [Exaiptasia diaphana]|nr:hypothetical protein AC249_AIPGENE10216 [Exaiptasia diaphana]
MYGPRTSPQISESDSDETIDVESDDDDNDGEHHELHFKVMGVVQTVPPGTVPKKTEESSENAVDVRLRPEPLNPYDSNAIAVDIDYGSGWSPVGYILKEMTKFVRPVITQKKLCGQRVGHIRFSASI